MPLDTASKRADFLALHREGSFLLPTAWDVAGARQLESLGFAAAATSIGSLAWSLGRREKDLTLYEVLAHFRQLVGATELPIDGDFGCGFATDMTDLMVNVRLALDTGIAALSIHGRSADRDDQTARISACRHAIDLSGSAVPLVARCDEPSGDRPIDDVIADAVACWQTGASLVCVSACLGTEAIAALVARAGAGALDVCMSTGGPTAAQLGALGVRRISVGDAFAQSSRMNFDRDARRFIDHGDLAIARARQVLQAAE